MAVSTEVVSRGQILSACTLVDPAICSKFDGMQAKYGLRSILTDVSDSGNVVI